VTVKAPAPTEADFMRSVTDYATRSGWLWVHMATATYKDAWRTPFSGPLGRGFADLMLFRAGTVVTVSSADQIPRRSAGRTLFAELKRGPKEKRDTPAAQLDFLTAARDAGNEAYLWEPENDWPEIEKVLA
jgi:hypothetical protein